VPCAVSDFVHKPVLAAEVLAALRPVAGGRYVDGTLGGGGHAAQILEASAPTGWLWGCDRDADALEAVRRRLAAFAGRFELRQADFAGLAAWVQPGSCDGVLFDLGVSSPQLDQPERGFSFQQEGPLDMRMDRSSGKTAADLVNTADVSELARVFRAFGEEPEAGRLARAIVQARQVTRFTTTGQLSSLVERVKPRHGARRHPATRVFQALRMAVNDELGSLRLGLTAALDTLKPGGRLAVITFHSVEDRVVKEFGRERARDYVVDGGQDVPELRRSVAPRLVWVSRKAIQPGAAEVAANPRARSAQLRVMEKL
jgi:16S rRNA (cytosine1402-N4)-methyltransferase